MITTILMLAALGGAIAMAVEKWRRYKAERTALRELEAEARASQAEAD